MLARCAEGVSAHCWQQELHEGLWQKRLGLPHARDSRLQSAHHGAQLKPSAVLVAPQGNRIFQKTPERRRDPIGETPEGTPKSEEKEQPHGRADIPHGDRTQRKGVRGKKWEKETAGLTMESPSSHLLTPLAASLSMTDITTRQGGRGRNEPVKGGRKAMVLMFVRFFPH